MNLQTLKKIIKLYYLKLKIKNFNLHKLLLMKNNLNYLMTFFQNKKYLKIKNTQLQNQIV